MSRRNTRAQAVVESLLDERRQYQAWLEKLAVPGAAGAPSLVVERVRADYESRLDNVTRQLARHEGELQTALAEAELRRDLAEGQRTARQDALNEAVLRHEVGEYGDEKFAGLSAEHAAFLAQAAEEIELADRDIARLVEVLGLVARVLPESAPPPSVPVAPAAPSAPAAAAPLAAAAAVGGVAAQLLGLDELSFLRLVAGGAKGGPASGAEAPAPPAPASPPAGAVAPTPQPAPEPVRVPRLSRPVMPPAALAPPPPAAPEPPAAAPPAPERAAPDDVAPPLAPEPSPELQPELRPERGPELRMGDLPLPMPVHHVVPDIPHEPRPSARASQRVLSAAEAAEDVARKSLRCTECGTLNLPTEWYCEKCGAELSAF